MTVPSKVVPSWEKVVIRLKSSVIKGFVEMPAAESIEAFLSDEIRSTPAVFKIRRLDSDAVEEIPVADAKAIFYVKSFEGDAERRALFFHSRGRIMQSVWIRVEFIDGEVMEGLIDNTGRFLCDPGFFMRPTDPNSNNRLVYVVKNWLRDCRVLGLRDM